MLKSVSTIKDQREDSPTDLLEWLYSLQEFEIYLVKLSSLTLLEKNVKVIGCIHFIYSGQGKAGHSGSHLKFLHLGS